MNKITNRLLYVAVNLIVTFGFVLPYLISAKNNELVLIGIGIGLINTYHIITFLINTFKSKSNEIN